MRALVLTMALAASFAVGTANAQELWQGAALGDTTDQLLEKFPDAQRLPERAIYKDGAYAEIMIDQRKVGGEVFDVGFVMGPDGLSSVSLRMSEDDTGQRPNSVTFGGLEEVLSRRYGAPLYEMPAKMSDPGFLRAMKNEFREGDLVISLWCMMCGKPEGSITIGYNYNAVARASEF